MVFQQPEETGGSQETKAGTELYGIAVNCISHPCWGPNITPPKSFSWLAVEERTVLRAFGRKLFSAALTFAVQGVRRLRLPPRSHRFLGFLSFTAARHFTDRSAQVPLPLAECTASVHVAPDSPKPYCRATGEGFGSSIHSLNTQERSSTGRIAASPTALERIDLRSSFWNNDLRR